jgi:hypothetical protein
LTEKSPNSRISQKIIGVPGLKITEPSNLTESHFSHMLTYRAKDKTEDTYYQRSINTILSSVQEVHRELLLEEEHAFIEQVLNLRGFAQRLFYRLCLRKPVWLQVKKLVYSDIDSIDEGLDELTEKGLCEGTVSTLVVAYEMNVSGLYFSTGLHGTGSFR